MATNGMTIDELNIISSLTANDEIPVWDNESTDEPTRKITAQNLANSVKNLAAIPTIVVGSISGADTSAGKTLMQMGVISNGGYYVLVLALVTSSTQDASSAYVLRYASGTLYIIGKLHEGTANGAPLLSDSGVISRKDGGTIATTYSLKYTTIFIPN